MGEKRRRVRAVGVEIGEKWLTLMEEEVIAMQPSQYIVEFIILLSIHAVALNIIDIKCFLSTKMRNIK